MIFYDKTNICGRYLQIDYEKKTCSWSKSLFLYDKLICSHISILDINFFERV